MRSTKVIFLVFIASIIVYSCKTKGNYDERTISFKDNETLRQKYIDQIKSINNNTFDSATYVGKNNVAIKYRLFQPAKKENKYPLVIVFHSSGKPIGTDNISQLGVLAKLFASEKIQTSYPSYILAPQFATRSSDYQMDDTRKILASKPRNCVDTVLELIDSLKQKLNIDPSRIYVIGFSMGGSTVINSINKRPDLFAAGISMSGIPEFTNLEALKKTPLWLIHGLSDTENPPNSDIVLFNELKPYQKIRFWKYEGVEHNNIFQEDLLGIALPDWLFKQAKKD